MNATHRLQSIPAESMVAEADEVTDMQQTAVAHDAPPVEAIIPIAEASTESPAKPPTVNNAGLAKLAPNVASGPTYGYYKLDVPQTRAEFDQLHAELNKRVEPIATAAVILDDAMPFLAKMQALLSQRGAERQKVLKEAGLPTWTNWLEGYTKRLGTSTRTIQRHIKELRDDGTLCLECGEKVGDCTCPELCKKCGQEKTACTCVKLVSIQEPYLEALQQLVWEADRAADRHADKALGGAVEHAICGLAPLQKAALGIRPKPRATGGDSHFSGEEDPSLAPEEVIHTFLTVPVRREFLTAVTSETELLVVLREMTCFYYNDQQTPESERNVKIELQVTSAAGQIIAEPSKGAKPEAIIWTPERRAKQGELIKAAIARKRLRAPDCAPIAV